MPVQEACCKWLEGVPSSLSTFGDRSTSKSMLKDYCVPRVFAEDLFQHVGKKKRPPFRFVSCAPEHDALCLGTKPAGVSEVKAPFRMRELVLLFLV
eukprot:832709-Pelagomonas_calceolata.AAC.1